MKKYRNKKRKYSIIFVVLLILISVTIFTIWSVRKERNLSFGEKTLKDVMIFMEDTLYAPIKYIKDKIEVYNQKKDIYEKYRELSYDIEDIDQKKAMIMELEKENKELRKMLELNDGLADYERINANVVSRDVGYWYDKLVIDKGAKDGIEKTMAVITSGGLVGYISEVSNHSSNVQLLRSTSFNHKVSIKIALTGDQFVTGIFNGYNEKTGMFMVEGISYAGEISEGSYVTTTGLSELFPSGILIGYVSSTTTDNFDLGKIVEVKPAVEFDSLDFVTVLKRKAQS